MIVNGGGFLGGYANCLIGTLAKVILLSWLWWGCLGGLMGSAWGEDSMKGLEGAKSTDVKGKEGLRERLTPLEFHVTQENGTEPPFANRYWDNHEAGIYVDVVTGEPLFSSLDKFDSGTGWPSFTKPISGDVVKTKEDRSHGMVRTEARSATGDSHLGHIFPDGPGPTPTRYCINSAALRFIPVSRLAAEGYGQFLEAFGEKGGSLEEGIASSGESRRGKDSSAAGGEACATSTETATLAGGCFWGVEDLIRKLPGVLETEVGYTGGTTKSPTYKDVSGGASGHAESVKITFDPTKVSYTEILRYFFRLHDPTTRNRQGNDIGTQYRSEIFVHSEAQRQAALEVIKEVNASGKWPRSVVTEISTAGDWYRAEDYHQDYLVKNPGGYTCHYLRD